MDTKGFDFIAGGPLPPDSPLYVKRPADDELLNSILAGQFCYVFSPHHLGKSSLMLRTEWQLQQHGVRTVTTDVNGIGLDAGVEQLYLLLLKRLKFQLKLSVDSDLWWTERASSGITPRFTDFLHDVVLAEVQDPIVVFIDGLSHTLNRALRDSFYAAIESIYHARATDPIYHRLTFVLLGVTLPADLVKNSKNPPLSFAQKIELSGFTWEESAIFQQRLRTIGAAQGEAIFTRIFYWTNGQPYLTQKLCTTIAKMWDGFWNEERVDLLVERLFDGAAATDEPDLRLVRDGVYTSPRRRQLLALYRQIYQGKQVAHNEHSPEQGWLKLVGLVRVENGSLKVNNEIYRLVFNLDWIKANAPAKSAYYIAVVSLLLLLLLGGVAGFFIQQQSHRTAEAQLFIDNFKSATSPEKRLTHLAELLNVPGFEDQARQLFYEELSLADQRALFELANPQPVGRELITLVKGLYTDPRLLDSEHANQLLDAMAQTLNKLEYTPALGSIELALEISQWRKGREYFAGQGQYQRAVEAYDVAIKMNDLNPGPYFDRGLAYAALDKPDQALADFITVIRLDESWQPRVRQTLLSHNQLYVALWDEGRAYQELAGLVPTPTQTSTPTPTPTPTDTPTATGTPTSTPTLTPRPSTPTPTATPTPVRQPISETPTLPAAPTPTPGVPVGTFTLLAPLAAEPSYGPTTFEWQWSGSLPPDYGFEVRVWPEGSPPTGVHNAVLDNQNGNITSLEKNTYRLEVDIKDAFGVRGRSGEYLWTVALVRINPKYADLGLQAPPGRLLFAAPGGKGDGKGGDGGGGGVGIE
jgi:tetratricopeptide (TPR) repeat protein